MAATTTLRILCLHDGDSNAAELKEQFELMGKKLYENHAIDLVYVNSPITLSTSSSSNHRPAPRVWWEKVAFERESVPSYDKNNATMSNDDTTTNNNNTEDDNDNVHYRGLDASLMLLRQIWTSCPFWGILGVGQGAAVASIFLTLLLSSSIHTNNDDDDEETASESNAFGNKSVLTPPQFAVFCSGQSLVQIDNEDNTSIAAGGFPVLHLVDKNIATSQEESLIRQFGGTVEHRRKATGPSDCSTKFESHDLNIIGRFVCEQKKYLFSSSSSSSRNKNKTEESESCRRQEIVSLQTALHLAEHQAANAIAEHIALNPPAALMAVIRPQAVVAGWQGSKRRQPGEEGGGAPCPTEFLLHPNQRQRSPNGDGGSNSSGASRIHPNQLHHQQQGGADNEMYSL